MNVKDVMTRSVNDYDDSILLERAVRNCRNSKSRKGVKHPRWVAVMDTFRLGSTYASQLCVRFGLDPDEQVKR